MNASISVEAVARRLGSCTPSEILRWALQTFGHDVAVACSFGGPSGMVLLDLLVQIDATIPIYYLDTGLLFEETYAQVRRVAEHYRITPIPVRATIDLQQQGVRYGERLWERDPDRCCALRKTEPQREFLKDFQAWVSGIRRDQTQTRASASVVEWDGRFNLVKVNPLLHWTHAMVWAYIHAHGVPYNPLHERGFASIGCTPCTRAIHSDEDIRAGRWSQHQKTECGLHR